MGKLSLVVNFKQQILDYNGDIFTIQDFKPGNKNTKMNII